MWGILRDAFICGKSNRITPTYVGNTPESYREQLKEQDHPHVCGEHGRTEAIKPTLSGSPPRMWGTQDLIKKYNLQAGITPTYVGNTETSKRRSAGHKDHPHVCGEHTGPSSVKLGLMGSPPRMWGTPSALLLAFSACGITPTYVGNT